MGIDISMSMGWGIHFSQAEIDKWLGEDEEYGAYECLEELVVDTGLTFSYAGNAWAGEENGFVIYAKETYQGFDMGRSAEAGVYRGSKSRLGLTSQYELDAASVAITGEHRPVEWLITVGVS